MLPFATWINGCIAPNRHVRFSHNKQTKSSRKGNHRYTRDLIAVQWQSWHSRKCQHRSESPGISKTLAHILITPDHSGLNHRLWSAPKRQNGGWKHPCTLLARVFYLLCCYCIPEEAEKQALLAAMPISWPRCSQDCCSWDPGHTFRWWGSKCRRTFWPRSNYRTIWWRTGGQAHGHEP